MRTDGLSSHRRLGQYGYTRGAIDIQASGDPAHVTMPAVHRFNRRTSTRRGLLFRRVLEQAVRTDPAPHHEAVGGRP